VDFIAALKRRSSTSTDLAARVKTRPSPYKSLGFNPVFFAMRASIIGPISSLS